jgi:predicted MFS family arabinose efflux permease
MGLLPLGAALGGILGRTLGLRAPFFITTAAALLVLALLAGPVMTTRRSRPPEPPNRARRPRFGFRRS